MGETRRAGARTGGPQRPQTRRQRKRAQQRGRTDAPRPRVTTPPPAAPTVQRLPIPEQTAEVKAPALAAEQKKQKKPRAAAPVTTTQPDTPAAPKPRAVPQELDADTHPVAAPVAAATPETPAPSEKRTLGRVAAKLKTHRTAPRPHDGAAPETPSAPDKRVRPTLPAKAERPRPFRTLAQMVAVTPRPRTTSEIAAPPATTSAAVSNVEPSAGSLMMAAGATFQPESSPARMPVAPRGRPAPPAGEPERRRAPVTRRLEHRLQEHALAASAASRANAQAERVSLGRSGPRLRYSLPEADLVLVAASIQAGLAAALALAGAGLLLAGRAGGAWPLALGGILGAGGWGAYALTQRERRGGTPLLISQLAALAWALALVGPRVAVLTLAAPLALYALRAAGRRAAGLCLLAALAIYGVALALALTGIIQPSVHLSDVIAPLADSALVGLALFGALGLAMELHAAREQATAEAHARLYEQRTLRAWLAALRQRDEENVARLRAVLEHVLQDRPVERPDLEGAHSSLGEYVAEIAAKLDGLRRDREDRLRLEGALRRLTRAMERAWLGLPWTWPDNSDTPVDDLVALLKTPSPREMEPPTLEDTPTLVPLPTLDAERRTPPLEIPALRDRQRQQGVHTVPWLAPSGTEGPPALLPAPKRSAPRTSPLPWREWDEWKDWGAGRER